MATLFRLVPAWEDTRTDLLEGRSVFLSAPRNFGKTYFYQKLLEDQKLLSKYAVVLINLNRMSQLSYKDVWEDIVEQTGGCIAAKEVQGKQEFVKAVHDIDMEKSVLFIVKANEANASVVIELINTFQEMAHDEPLLFIHNHVLLLLDDLTLHFYQSSLKMTSSVWDLFESKRQLFGLTDATNISHILQEFVKFRNNAKEYGKIILETTGGHHGLIYNLFFSLKNSKKNIGLAEFKTWCEQEIYNADIIAHFKEMIEMDQEYLTAALDFREKKMLMSNPGNMYRRVHSDGIVLRLNAVFSKMCTGVVAQMVQEISADQPSGNVPVVPAGGIDKLVKEEVKEIFISYAWKKKEALVMRLHTSLNKQKQLRAVIDKNDLPYQESITAFMKRIGEGSSCIVIISDKYLKSQYCMYELYELYRNSNHNGDVFRRKIYPIKLEQLQLNNPEILKDYIKHWKEEEVKWSRLIKEETDVIGKTGFESYQKIRNIANHASDMLHVINDLNASKPYLLSRANFQPIIKAIRSNLGMTKDWDEEV